MEQHLWRWLHRGSDDWWSCGDDVMIFLSNQKQLWPWIISPVLNAIDMTTVRASPHFQYINNQLNNDWHNSDNNIIIFRFILSNIFITVSKCANSTKKLNRKLWCDSSLRNYTEVLNKTQFEILLTWSHLRLNLVLQKKLETRTKLVHLKTVNFDIIWVPDPSSGKYDFPEHGTKVQSIFSPEHFIKWKLSYVVCPLRFSTTYEVTSSILVTAIL